MAGSVNAPSATTGAADFAGAGPVVTPSAPVAAALDAFELVLPPMVLASPPTTAIAAATPPALTSQRLRRRETTSRRNACSRSASRTAASRRRATVSSSRVGIRGEDLACTGEGGTPFRRARRHLQARGQARDVGAEIERDRVELPVDLRGEDLVELVRWERGGAAVVHGHVVGCSEVVSRFPRRSASAARPREIRERTVPAGIPSTSAISA